MAFLFTNSRIQRVQEDCQSEIDQIRSRFQKQISQKDGKIAKMASAHQAETQSLKDKYASDISIENERHRQERQDLRSDIETLKTDAERERQRASQTMSQMKIDHNGAVDYIKQTHAAEVAGLEQMHKEQSERLKAEHDKKVQRLLEEVQEINEALLARDDEMYQGKAFSASGLPRNPDEKKRNQIQEVQRMVEELGRLTWRKNQALWTDQVFQAVPGHQGHRVLKKNILQDLIWTLLYNYVFCTPFRVFGEEGRRLETEWVKACGEDESFDDEIMWPPPSIKAERWRYMTIKECREALEIKLNEIDPRARAKHGFKSSQKDLITALKTELGEIVDLTAADLQLIQHLSLKAATTWLDFTMHRCRIVVGLTGSDARTTAEKVALVRNESLMLTVLPIVGRYGNVKGVELERWTVIAGCAGENVIIP